MPIAPPGYGVNTSGQFVNMADAQAQYAQAQQRGRDMMAQQNRWTKGVKLASFGLIGGAAGAAALGAGGAAGAAGASSPGIVGPLSSQGLSYAAPATAKGFSFNNLLSLGQLAGGLYGNITGQRAQTKATNSAQAEQARQFEMQIQMAREAEQTRQAEVARQNAETERQWNAQQLQQQQQYALQQEDRDRSIADRDRRIQLENEAEARKAPRRALSQQALMRISSLLNMGRR